MCVCVRVFGFVVIVFVSVALKVGTFTSPVLVVDGVGPYFTMEQVVCVCVCARARAPSVCSVRVLGVWMWVGVVLVVRMGVYL